MEKSKIRQNNRAIGTYYEQKAARYMADEGYKILTMNYRTRLGEIDMIAHDGEYTIFIEIKYRKDSRCGLPRENVHARKQNVLIKVATHFLVKHNLYESPIRFDVIEILGEHITHIKNAF